MVDRKMEEMGENNKATIDWGAKALSCAVMCCHVLSSHDSPVNSQIEGLRFFSFFAFKFAFCWINIWKA